MELFVNLLQKYLNTPITMKYLYFSVDISLYNDESQLQKKKGEKRKRRKTSPDSETTSEGMSVKDLTGGMIFQKKRKL